MVRVSVIDGGPGISEDLAHVLFERGVHREGSTGQGLGLAMARDLVRIWAGRSTSIARPARALASTLTLPAADLGGAA